jgi:uncharacterized membrane protein
MKRTPTEWINLAFSAIMILITFMGAIMFLFTDLMSDKAFGNKRIILGVIFLSYAIYRSYRVYLSLKNVDIDTKNN